MKKSKDVPLEVISRQAEWLELGENPPDLASGTGITE
jgi:hypothetical protein